MITALIAAVATIIAALITGLLANGSGGESPPPAAQPPQSVRNSVGITSFTESPAPPHGKTYVFTGTAASFRSGMAVYVITRNPAGDSSDEEQSKGGDAWLVSPKADILQGGRWKVTWKLKKPPPRGEWTAVLVSPSGFDEHDSNAHWTYDVPALRTHGVLSDKVAASGKTK
ncbi:hypothetical protein ABT390_36615 [Streptomyces aurantiacus]|nr:hypothetical protein [Streptomyces aurantiacus]